MRTVNTERQSCVGRVEGVAFPRVWSVDTIDCGVRLRARAPHRHHVYAATTTRGEKGRFHGTASTAATGTIRWRRHEELPVLAPDALRGLHAAHLGAERRREAPDM